METTRPLLGRPNGVFIAPPCSRSLVTGGDGEVIAQSETHEPADADTLVASAEALLA